MATIKVGDLMKKVLTLLFLVISISLFSQTFDYVKVYNKQRQVFSEPVRVNVRFVLFENSSSNIEMKYDRLIINNAREDDIRFPYKGKLIDNFLFLTGIDKNGDKAELTIYKNVVYNSLEFLISTKTDKYIYGILLD